MLDELDLLCVMRALLRPTNPPLKDPLSLLSLVLVVVPLSTGAAPVELSGNKHEKKLP